MAYNNCYNNHIWQRMNNIMLLLAFKRRRKKRNGLLKKGGIHGMIKWRHCLNLLHILSSRRWSALSHDNTRILVNCLKERACVWSLSLSLSLPFLLLLVFVASFMNPVFGLFHCHHSFSLASSAFCSHFQDLFVSASFLQFSSQD